MPKDLIYIDCYATVGRRGPKDERAAWKTETLLDEMEHCGIHGALVTHALAREYDPSFGNQELTKELAKSSRLYGCWVLLPHHCNEMPRGRDLVKQMRDHGIRAAKMYPKLHKFDFDEATCGEIFTALEEAGIPLFVECGLYENYAQVTFKEIAAVASAHPDLNLVMLATRWESPRQLFPLMEKHRNLYLEFSALQANRAIEVFAERFGADRLLFGTEFPEKSPGAAKAFVDYAQITDNQRRLIAGGNLARLLQLAHLPEPYSEKAEKDSILARVKEGKPLTDILVIDSHAHISHDDGWGTGFMPIPYSDAKSMVERNAVIGIDKMCVSSWLGIWADYSLGNELVRKAVEQFPTQIVGYATLDPNYVENWEAEIRRCHEQYGFKGIKPYYPRTRVPYNSPKWAPWFRYGNEHRLFALMHPSDNFTEEMLDLSARYQGISFLLAHSGMTFKAARDHCEIAKQRDNVYLEITYTSVTHGSIELMVEEVGADRVLFGTDAPMRDPIPQFGWLAYAHLSEEDKRKIFGENMQKILERCR